MAEHLFDGLSIGLLGRKLLAWRNRGAQPGGAGESPKLRRMGRRL